MLFNIDTVCSWTDAPAYARISKQTGIRECLSNVLNDGTSNIGVLTLWSDREGGFDAHHVELIRYVAAQISIIVNNILAEELIKEKEKEIAILLSVSNAIASIRDKNDLVYIIQKTLQSFLKYSDIAITKFNLEKGTFKVFLEYCEKTVLQPDFEAIAYSEYPIVVVPFVKFSHLAQCVYLLANTFMFAGNTTGRLQTINGAIEAMCYLPTIEVVPADHQ